MFINVLKRHFLSVKTVHYLLTHSLQVIYFIYKETIQNTFVRILLLK